MKLHEFAGAPIPRRSASISAERRVSRCRRDRQHHQWENRQPEFLKKNPMGGLPVRARRDGSYLPESLAIMEYFEELHPNPPMIGTTRRSNARASERSSVSSSSASSAASP